MIYVKGNILDAVQPNNIIVHGCNAQSVMGAGLAKLISDRFPAAFENYKMDLLWGAELGYVSYSCFYANKDSLERDFGIASAIIQEFYGREVGRCYVSYDAIASVFADVFENAKAWGWRVNFPKIGAGLGGGKWDIIEDIINSEAKKCGMIDDHVICWEL